MNKTVRQILSIGIMTLLLSQIGFSQAIEKYFDSTIKVDNRNVPTDLNQPYFPLEMFPYVRTDWVKVNDSLTIIRSEIIEGTYADFTMNFFSKYLHAMEEPLLFNKKIDKEIYRFTWLRSFHKPMTFRFEKKNDSYIMFYKVLSIPDEYGNNIGEIECFRLKILSKKEWIKFTQLIEKANFWEMRLGNSSYGDDGSQWIMEGVNQSNYRVVSAWTPSKGAFFNACNYLISLMNLKIPEKEKY
ncbi:hypothetical protein ACFQ0I_16420 [Mariniflexile aquimaris]|uniref:START domain-containing protein n=1 Tax=Mariniflexile aquimaris TaxID=881009 RepID=A0ABW3BXT5_9FLAO